MDPIKEAFRKAKQDVFDLQAQITSLRRDISEIKDILNRQTNQQTNLSVAPSIQQEIPTQELSEPYNYSLEALKTPISHVSTGNEGVPTNRQTNQQTNRQIENGGKSPSKPNNNIYLGTTQEDNKENNRITSQIDRIEHISNTLQSLDSIKRDLRQQFKRLTNQEMLVFSTLYQLENEHFTVDYSLIASKLKLSESSIRDYFIKIVKKGIPITKLKQNNKKILLKIPGELKQLASLQTLMALREL